MPEYTETDETRVPENDERAVGVASVPEDHDAVKHDAVKHDAVKHDAVEHDTADDGDVPESAEAQPVDEPVAPTQRIDAEQPPVDHTAPDDELHDYELHDNELHDDGVRDNEPRGDVFRHDEARYDGAGDDGVNRDDAERDDPVGRDDAPVPAIAYELAGGGTVTEDDVTHDELMPGDVPEQQVSALFEPSQADGFRDRWQRVQMQFVDDPKSAADQARQLVDDVFTAAREALDKQRGALDSWQSGERGQPDDTERLRVAVRGYRDFLDRMLGL